LIHIADELLIDFRELIGKHSGENMAETAWATMEQYNLVGRVCCNACRIWIELTVYRSLPLSWTMRATTMLMALLEKCCNEQHVPFSATNARMQCLPHTVHLAVIKLLEGIRAMSKAEGKKASVCSINYQDNITTPLDCIYNNNTMANDEIEDLDLDYDLKIGTGYTADGVMPAIEKVHEIIELPCCD
jgi:hypothetical protein